MKTEVREVVDQMFKLFGQQDIEGLVALFAEDAELVHHGTQIMPSARFIGREGARMFFEYNINALKVVYFNVNEYVEAEGNRLLVFGNEYFIALEDGSEMKNTWVQIYTVKEGKILKMEEFATSADPNSYAGNA